MEASRGLRPLGRMMRQRTPYIALGLVILVSLILLKLPARATRNLKLAVSGLFVPLFGATSSTAELAETTALHLLPRAELIRQFEDLRRQQEVARIHAMQHQEVLRENARLRQQLLLPRQHPDWTLRLARVVGRDPANWWRAVRIDLGARDGITTNLPVLTPEGLVGRVSETAYAHSQVVLVGDPNCRVSVLVRETGDTGIIAPESSAPLDSTLVELGYLSRSSKLQVGQQVVTSGLGGIFPKGILVGQIAYWRTVDELYRKADVALAVKLNALEEVWVRLR